MDDQPKILIVDDKEMNLRLLEAMLLPLGYEVILATNGREALDRVEESPPDVILLDVMMPNMDGFEVTEILKKEPRTARIPVVMVTALKDVKDRVRALEAGADDFLTKPVDKTELRTRVQSLLKIKAYNDHMADYQRQLEEEVEKRTHELQSAFEKIKFASLDTIYRLSRAAVYKDEGTGSHIKRMTHYAVAIARRLGFDDATSETLLYATPMHDIGKIGIPDRILLKPGKLDPTEWETMKQHTTIGALILENSDAEYIKMGERIALSHHEKWDGSGYPRALRGENIPIEGRIAAMADVFDALTSERPYKKPFSIEESLRIIKEGKGTHFDPDIVDATLDIMDEIRDIKATYSDDDESLLFQRYSLFD